MPNLQKLPYYNKKEDTYDVPCLADRLSAPGAAPITVTVPGSKSITNRALLLATLANGSSTLRGVLFSDDSRHFLDCVQKLGFETSVDEAARTVTVTGLGGAVPLREASLYVGSAGTAARFLTAYLGVSNGIYHMDASAQMRRRPMAPLLASLKELGCEISYEEIGESGEGYFPLTLCGHGFGTDTITVDIDRSSQFLSALLISSCLSERDFRIHVQGTHGMSYIDMTCRMMEQFGVRTERTGENEFLTRAGQAYQPRDYQVEPDVSAACYFYAMAPLLGIPVQVRNVHYDSLQGDIQFFKVLMKMGCMIRGTREGNIVVPPADGIFHGVTADLSAFSDQAITLAAIAPYADSPTTITGIGHIRFQESDRISAIVTELRRMGIRCEETDSSITIYPGTPQPSVVETYDDHRMAMGFSLIGLRAPGIRIHDPGCCRKTFENYFGVFGETVQKLLYRS